MLVETLQLTKRYAAVTALEGCSVSVAAGEVFGLLGPNGSGKTTLLRLLMGYLAPTSGTARIGGLDCYRQSLEVRRRTAYLPGEARVFPRMRGREALNFFARARGVDPARVLHLAERLELDVRRRVARMSTGMRQKLALAATMASDTPLVILDEPTANLDPTARGEVLKLVREARDAGRTVIFSSHVLSEIEQTCDRVCILRQGELVHEQVIRELKRQHRIRAQLRGPLPPLSSALQNLPLDISHAGSELTIVTPVDLAAILGWLSTLPLAEVSIEPLGLQAVYQQFHSAPLREVLV